MEEQEKKLRDEILADAKQRSERVVARAQRDAENARRRTVAANERRRQEVLDETRRESALKKRNLVAGAWGESRNMWLKRREACIDELLALVMQRVEALPAGHADRLASLEAVAAEALAALLPAKEVKVFCSPVDLATVTEAWLAARCPDGTPVPAFTIAADEAIRGGIRMASGDGLRSCDNTYAARLVRSHGDYRSILAAVIPADFEEP